MNYERVNWENGTQVEGAYVEIDGTRYPVVMPTYNCDTPVTATNLNVMDEAIDDLSKELKKEEIPLILQSNVREVEAVKMYHIGNIVNIKGIVYIEQASYQGIAYTVSEQNRKYLPSGLTASEFLCSSGGNESVLVSIGLVGMMSNIWGISVNAREKNVYIDITYMI